MLGFCLRTLNLFLAAKSVISTVLLTTSTFLSLSLFCLWDTLCVEDIVSVQRILTFLQIPYFVAFKIKNWNEN